MAELYSYWRDCLSRAATKTWEHYKGLLLIPLVLLLGTFGLWWLVLGWELAVESLAIGILAIAAAVVFVIVLFIVVLVQAGEEINTELREQIASLTPAQISVVASYPRIKVTPEPDGNTLIVLPSLRIQNHDLQRSVDLALDLLVKPYDRTRNLVPLESLDYEISHWIPRNYRGQKQLHQPVHIEPNSWVEGNAVFAAQPAMMQELPDNICSVESMEIQISHGNTVLLDDEVWPTIWLSTLGLRFFERRIEEARSQPELPAKVPAEPVSRIPKNRDALVTCIVRLEQAVVAAISEYRVREMYREQYGTDYALDRTKLAEVLNARKELAVQIGVAGQDFSLHLRYFADTVDLPLNEYQAAEEEGRSPLGQEVCAAAEKKVWDQTADVLQRLDAGELYLPRGRRA